MTRKRPPSYVTHFTAGWGFGSALCHRRRFKEFREMYAKWEFRLVFCVDVLDNFIDYTIQSLRDIVGVEKAGGGLDYLLHELLITSEMRPPRTRLRDDHMSWAGTWNHLAGAL